MSIIKRKKNKDLHLSFRVNNDMMSSLEELMSEVQKRSSGRVTYSRFFRAQIDILARDPELRKKMVDRIAEIIDLQ